VVRLRIAGAVIVAAFALLAARAVQLAVIDGRGAERGRAQTGTVLRLAPARGAIVDRSGAELALTVSAPSVYAVPRAIADPAAAAAALAPVLGTPVARLRTRLEHGSSFVFLERWVEPAQARAVEALGLGGVGIVQEPRRAYPHRELASQIVGFANIDGEGVRGVEQMEDAWLRGKARRIAVERDARGHLLADAGTDPRIAAGRDVALTLDATLQAESETALDEVVEATGARGGVVVALDPATGELLAVAERPGFDPNRFRETPYATTRSRAFLDAPEPGSSLKPFVVALALQDGALAPDELVDCEEGSFRVPGKTLSDVKPHGLLDPGGVLRVSSNIGAAKIGFKLGPEAHWRGLRAFGFGDATGSGFPDESSGLLRDWQRWRTLDHATISFGQGINVTPVQLAAASAALANGGVWRAPRLLAARREPGGRWKPEAPPATHRVLRPRVADRVLHMMEGVVGPEGTGKYAALRGVRVAGKTGTAQKLDPETGSYSSRRYLAWFVGIAPADDPRLVVVVMVDEPRGMLHSGGAVAAPLFARVAASRLAREGVLTEPERELHALARWDWKEATGRRVAKAEPKREAPPVAPAPRPATPAPTVARSQPTLPLPELERLGDRVFLPDLRGLTNGQVRALRARIPVPVELSGNGRVVDQDPAPGTILAAGAGRVRVRFESHGEGG
jgi:cell division protein FtsI (penicillin-binding protein 3)